MYWAIRGVIKQTEQWKEERGKLSTEVAHLKKHGYSLVYLID